VFPLVDRPQRTWGARILAFHLKYVAGCTSPLLFVFERTHNYPVDNQGLLPWRLRRLGGSNVRLASSVRCVPESNQSVWRTTPTFNQGNHKRPCHMYGRQTESSSSLRSPSGKTVFAQLTVFTQKATRLSLISLEVPSPSGNSSSTSNPGGPARSTATASDWYEYYQP